MTPLPDKYSIFNHLLHLKNKYPNDTLVGYVIEFYADIPESELLKIR